MARPARDRSRTVYVVTLMNGASSNSKSLCIIKCKGLFFCPIDEQHNWSFFLCRWARPARPARGSCWSGSEPGYRERSPRCSYAVLISSLLHRKTRFEFLRAVRFLGRPFSVNNFQNFRAPPYPLRDLEKLGEKFAG